MRKEVRFASALAVERTLSFLDKFIDAAIIGCIIIWGPIAAYAVGVGLSFIFCLAVLELHLQSSKRGFDVTGIEDLKEWATTETEEGGYWLSRITTETSKRFLRFLSGSYWTMLLIGSVFYLECDYVTLFLRKKNEGRLSVIFRVMIPSVLWGLFIWTGFYWLTWTYASQLFVEIAGCSGEGCLARPEWQWLVHALESLGALF